MIYHKLECKRKIREREREREGGGGGGERDHVIKLQAQLPALFSLLKNLKMYVLGTVSFQSRREPLMYTFCVASVETNKTTK